MTWSAADRALTVRLKQALDLVDVRVLNHVVAGDSTASFAERGWIEKRGFAPHCCASWRASPARLRWSWTEAQHEQ